MEQLPNLVSCFRIVMSIVLLFSINEPALFAVAYSLCGISDVADGHIARRLGVETTLGTKLDSVGDFIFFTVWLYILLAFVNNGNGGLMIACAITVAIIRITNLVITKVKFKRWGVMHTVGNKLTGFLLFLVLPVCIFAGGIPSWAVIAVSAVSALSSLEESAILLKFKSYDANRRSVL